MIPPWHHNSRINALLQPWERWVTINVTFRDGVTFLWDDEALSHVRFCKVVTNWDWDQPRVIPLPQWLSSETLNEEMCKKDMQELSVGCRTSIVSREMPVSHYCPIDHRRGPGAPFRNFSEYLVHISAYDLLLPPRLPEIQYFSVNPALDWAQWELNRLLTEQHFVLLVCLPLHCR